jgi:hypothetical protein
VKPPKSCEFDIRSAVVRRLLLDGFARDQIRLEIPLDIASSEGRADIVLLTDRIQGIELKSGKDKFCPVAIKEQCRQYNRAFDACGTVIDVAHRREWDEKLDHGTRFHSNWREVDVQYCHESRQLQTVWREPIPDLCNQLFQWPSQKTSVYDMCLLLWAAEAKDIAGSKTGKYEFCNRMREYGRLSEVRPLVIASLKNRPLNKWEASFWRRFDAVAAGLVSEVA